MILKYNLPKQWKVSTNKIYSWIHWKQREKIADYFHNLVLDDCKQLKPITHKVNLDFKFYYKSRYLDSSNNSFVWKMLEDGLVKGWLLKDDDNKYIWQVSYESVLIDKKVRKEMESDFIRLIIT